MVCTIMGGGVVCSFLGGGGSFYYGNLRGGGGRCTSGPPYLPVPRAPLPYVPDVSYL